MGFFDRNWKAVAGFQAQLVAPGTVNGSAVNLFGYEDAAIVLDVGAMDTGATLAVKVQESADGSTGWVDVTGAAFSTLTKAAHENSVHVGSILASGRKGWIRVVATAAVGNVRVGGFVLLGSSATPPVTQTFAATGFRV